MPHFPASARMSPHNRRARASVWLIRKAYLAFLEAASVSLSTRAPTRGAPARHMRPNRVARGCDFLDPDGWKRKQPETIVAMAARRGEQDWPGDRMPEGPYVYCRYATS